MVKKILLMAGLITLIITIRLFAVGQENEIDPIRAIGDLDNNGMIEEYVLANHCLTVREDDRIIWQSPQGWSVDSFALGDIDNDGSNNLVISLWKKGSFGEIKPFWFQGKDNSYKNHLFVLELIDNTFKSVWCSSNLDHPIISFAISDVDGDGLNELVVQEGKYRRIKGEYYALDKRAAPKTVIWQWQEWGFSR
jgi:hypothetical protein